MMLRNCVPVNFSLRDMMYDCVGKEKTWNSGCHEYSSLIVHLQNTSKTSSGKQGEAEAPDTALSYIWKNCFNQLFAHFFDNQAEK